MQRRLINALQDIKVEYDGTVRNAVGELIQFRYGDDDIDVSRSDHGKAVNVSATIEKVLSQFDESESKLPSEDIIKAKLKNAFNKGLISKSIMKDLENKLLKLKAKETKNQ